jgi:hypothetical protein
MEPVFGNHLGMVISNQDPEGRKRVQIFIPYLSNTLFSKWNTDLKDIKFKNTVELDNLGVLSRLKQTLPWAEAAAPIFGGATSMTSNSVTRKVGVNNSTPTYADYGLFGAPEPAASVPSDSTTPLTGYKSGEYSSSGADYLDSTSSFNTSNMSPAFRNQYERVLKSLEGTRFAPTDGSKVKPEDGDKFGVYRGTKEEWAHFFTRLAAVESTFESGRISTIDGARTTFANGRSFGLYQLGIQETDSWAYYGKGDILNPDDNTNAFVKYAEDMYFGGKHYKSRGGTNNISAVDSNGKILGIAAGFGPLRRARNGDFLNNNEPQVLGENMSESEKRSGSYNNSVVASSDTNVIDPNDAKNVASASANAYTSASGSPNGAISIPNEGAKVWVFFYGGDIQKPVYFASAIEGST